MKTEKTSPLSPPKRAFWLRYGTFLLLLVLLAGTLVILCRFTLRTKTPLEIFSTGHAAAVAYMDKEASPVPRNGDTLNVTTGSGVAVRFLVVSVREEPAAWVLRLESASPLSEMERAMQGNSRQTVYLHTGRLRLINLVFRKAR